MPSLMEDAVAVKKGKLKIDQLPERRQRTVQQLADAIDSETIAASGPVKRHTTMRSSALHKVKAS